LWQERYDAARSFALSMPERESARAGLWQERAGDAAFYARELQEARSLYKQAASSSNVRCGRGFTRWSGARPREGGWMAAYVIAEIEVTDVAGYEEYRKQVPPVIARYGGRYIARGGETVSLEGAPPHRTVILEFPTLADAKAWWECAEYQALKAIRDRTARSRLVAVTGIDG
jgi:uncharacterized protein (DUF1330 family)